MFEDRICTLGSCLNSATICLDPHDHIYRCAKHSPIPPETVGQILLLLDIAEEEQQKERDEHENRMERQRARRKIDKTSKDANGNGKADKREGKDVSHRKALSKGGRNKDGVTIQSPSKNRSFKRDKNSKLVSETSKKESKKK